MTRDYTGPDDSEIRREPVPTRERVEEPEGALVRERVSESEGQSPAESARSVAHLMGELVADAQHMFRREIDLARQEVRDDVSQAVRGGAMLGAGGAVAAVGGLFILFSIVYLLSEVFGINLWVSYLIVGVILAIIGGILLLVGRSQVQQVDPAPRETIDSLRKDVEWAKEQQPFGKK